MPAHPSVVQSYVRQYTLSALKELERDALEVFHNSGEISRSYEGSSITINQENCVSVLECVVEAIALKEAQAAGSDPSLTRGPLGVPVDFSLRRIE